MWDTAWIVLHADDQAAASTHSEVVIAEIDGYLITSPDYCETDMEELMWELIIRSDDGQTCLNIWPIGDCYHDYEAANAVVESEMG